jgi:hypothetical protein
MPVVWVGPGQHWDNPGMAVHCHTCNAYAGQPCEITVFRINPDEGSCHRARVDYAETLGFRLATRQTFLQARHVLENAGASAVQPEGYFLGGDPEPRIGEPPPIKKPVAKSPTTTDLFGEL